MAVSREQLLALKPGETITDGEMSACRAPVDEPRQIDPRGFYFWKHYREGKLTWFVLNEMVEDDAVNPWSYAGDCLDREARRQRRHPTRIDAGG